MADAIAQAAATARPEGSYAPLSVTLAGALRVTDAAFATAIGSPTDAAWDGDAASATVIAILKKIALDAEPAP